MIRPSIKAMMSQREQVVLRRQLLRALMVIAVGGVCACGRVDQAKKPNPRARKVELAYRNKLLAKVKKGWDGNIAATKKKKRIESLSR
jgi:hypothetical protein